MKSDPCSPWCPKCGRKWDNPHPIVHVCPECQEERKMHIAYINALYPSASELGLQGTKDIPIYLINRPHSSGRRVIRKSEPMGG